LPGWITGQIQAWRPEYLDSVLDGIEQFVRRGSADDLGHFLEGSGEHDQPGIHGVMHGIISDFEELNFGKQPFSDMGKMQTSPYNEHFWGLHGWIDTFYARWQTIRGEMVDQSPLPPHVPPPPICSECVSIPDALDPAVNPKRWLGYLTGSQNLE
jgi:hypothetical protein